MNKEEEELTFWKNEAIKQRADFLMLSEYIRKIGIQPVFWANGGRLDKSGRKRIRVRTR
jgi:hypothetical protein